MKRVILFAAMLSMAGAIYFGYLSIREYCPVRKAETKKEILNETVISQRNPCVDSENYDKFRIEEMDENKAFLKEEKKSVNLNIPYYRAIDFDTLHRINTDIVGWIYIPGTSIDYPILIGNTDHVYLDKDFEGKESVLGAIFSYADTAKTLSDARTILFGHNMKSYQMFGELKRYLEEDFRNTHNTMYVYTKTKTMELQVFSIFVCDEKDTILWDDAETGSLEYQELLRELERRNVYADVCMENLSEKYHSQTFSLVTCKGNVGTSKRLMVNGIVIKEKYIGLEGYSLH